MEREDDLPSSLVRLRNAGKSETSVNSVNSATKHENPASGGGGVFRQRLSVRPELEADLGSNNGSEIMNESVVSSLTDRYGFMSGTDNQAKETQDPTLSAEEVEVLKRRELKWLQMLKNWETYMMKDYKKVRERCRKGVPSSVRARAWLQLSGAQFYLDDKNNRTEFKRLYNQRGNQKWIDDIEKDLHRNFPTHEMFGGTYERIGQAELYRVLKAYSVLNPTDGYCQAMAPIAALLLMSMPAEQAFWVMVMVCDKYIPGYYSPGMEAIQLDGDILHGLLKKVAPSVHRHLMKQEIEPILYMTEWFLCAFARTLPWPTVMRVWDMFMCEGVKVLFRVALVLVKFSLTKEVRKNCPSMYETLDVLKNLPERVTEEHFLVDQILRLELKEEAMEREHRKQLLKRKAAKNGTTTTTASASTS